MENYSCRIGGGEGAREECLADKHEKSTPNSEKLPSCAVAMPVPSSRPSLVPQDRAKFVEERAGRAAALRQAEESKRRAAHEQRKHSSAAEQDYGRLSNQLSQLDSLLDKPPVSAAQPLHSRLPQRGGSSRSQVQQSSSNSQRSRLQQPTQMRAAHTESRSESSSALERALECDSSKQQRRRQQQHRREQHQQPALRGAAPKPENTITKADTFLERQAKWAREKEARQQERESSRKGRQWDTDVGVDAKPLLWRAAAEASAKRRQSIEATGARTPARPWDQAMAGQEEEGEQSTAAPEDALGRARRLLQEQEDRLAAQQAERQQRQLQEQLASQRAAEEDKLREQAQTEAAMGEERLEATQHQPPSTPPQQLQQGGLGGVGGASSAVRNAAAASQRRRSLQANPLAGISAPPARVDSGYFEGTLTDDDDMDPERDTLGSSAVGEPNPLRQQQQQQQLGIGGYPLPSSAFTHPGSDAEDESEADWFQRLDAELNTHYGLSYEHVLGASALEALQAAGLSTAQYRQEPGVSRGGGAAAGMRAAANAPRAQDVSGNGGSGGGGGKATVTKSAARQRASVFQPDDAVTCSGWLQKRGKLLSGWQRRWFQVAGNYLTYRSSEDPSAELKASVDLRDVQVDVGGSGGGGDDVFHIRSLSASKVIMSLRAPSAQEAENWVVHLRDVTDAVLRKTSFTSNRFRDHRKLSEAAQRRR